MEEIILRKKILAFGIITILILINNNSTGFNISESSESLGQTLYVGGSGPGNYTKIQKAIDDSNPGGTVFVYNGTYIENVRIDKSIRVIGEDKNTTFVNSNPTQRDWVFELTAGDVEIKGFTVQHGTAGIGAWSEKDYIENINISDCNIVHNYVDWWGGLSIIGDYIDNISITYCYFNDNRGLAGRISSYTKEMFSNLIISNCCFDDDGLRIAGVKNILSVKKTNNNNAFA